VAPDDARLHHNRAAALADAGRVDEAVAQLRALLRVAPDDAAAHLELAGLLLRDGRAGEARDELVAARRAALAAGDASLAASAEARLAALPATP